MPTSAAVGVPDNSPVAVSNAAQLGAFFTLKVSAAPLGSALAGVKLYAVPATTEVKGVPDIVGVASAADVAPVPVVTALVAPDELVVLPPPSTQPSKNAEISSPRIMWRDILCEPRRPSVATDVASQRPGFRGADSGAWERNHRQPRYLRFENP